MVKNILTNYHVHSNSIDVLFYRGHYNPSSIVSMPILREDYPIDIAEDVVFLLITDKKDYCGGSEYQKLKRLMERYLEVK